MAPQPLRRVLRGGLRQVALTLTLPFHSCPATDHTKYGKHAKRCPASGYCTNCMPIDGALSTLQLLLVVLLLRGAG